MGNDSFEIHCRMQWLHYKLYQFNALKLSYKVAKKSIKWHQVYFFLPTRMRWVCNCQEGSEEKEEVGLVRDALGNARTALSFILLITPAWVASTKILHCWHSFPPVPGLNAIGFNYLSKEILSSKSNSLGNSSSFCHILIHIGQMFAFVSDQVNKPFLVRAWAVRRAFRGSKDY